MPSLHLTRPVTAQLIDACLDHKPANRPSAKELVGILNEQGRCLEQLRSSRIRTASPVNSRVSRQRSGRRLLPRCHRQHLTEFKHDSCYGGTINGALTLLLACGEVMGLCEPCTRAILMLSMYISECCWRQGTDSDCSEELVEAIVALARVIGGPASGITNEEAVEAARFRDDLKIQKCGLAVPTSNEASAGCSKLCCCCIGWAAMFCVVLIFSMNNVRHMC